MKALETSNAMHHFTGCLKDAAAGFLGLAFVGRHLTALIAFVDPAWLQLGGILGAVVVGRAIDILYKEIKARRRRKRYPDEKEYF